MMYQFQESLPKLPVPTLEETCQRYLQIVAPLLNKEDFAKTEAVVKDFQQGIGLKLQRQLEMFAQSTTTSYIYEAMEDGRLDYREPLFINANFGGVLSPITHPSELSFTHLAAIWIVDTLNVYLTIKRRELEPDRDTPRSGGQPLCMVQYNNLFGCSRIPGIKRDTWRCSVESEHIIIIWHNVFYALHVIRGEQIATVEAIAQSLQSIVETTKPGAPALGALTALKRTQWAILHDYMATLDPHNARSLEVLDRALFVVCLDDTTPPDLEAASKMALHGDGCNRWFDKPLQLIFAANGQGAINIEHSGLDGYPVMRYLYEVNRSRQQPREASVSTALPLEPPTQVTWNLDAEILGEIEQAQASVEGAIAQLETCLLEFEEFGRDGIKKHRLSPDAVVQLAIQLAYARFYGSVACVYESVHTRRFRYGRTEAMRSVTPESVKLIDVFTNKASQEARFTALKQAVTAHSERIAACQQGFGVDRHLAALYRLARYQGEVPEVFQDKGYTEALGQSVLSTSSLAADMGLEVFCFSPVVEQGYGIGYIIKRDGIVLNVTSRYRRTGKFVELLRQSLSDLGRVMVQGSKE